MPDISIKKYRNIKSKIKRTEANNYDSIYVLPCSGNQNWYEIAEHSALFYFYEVCQQLNLKTKFMADTLSFYDQYRIGYVRALGVDGVRDNLRKLDLLEKERKEGEVYVFKLKKIYEPKDVQELEAKETKRRQENLSIAPARHLDPVLHQLLVTASIRLHRICNSRLDKLASQVNGVKIVILIDRMLETYHQITMSTKAPAAKINEKLMAMRKDAYDLLIQVQVLGEAKLWDLELCSSVSATLFEIRDQIERDISKMQKKAKNGAGKS